MQLHESTVRQDAKTPGRGQSTRRDSRRGAWPAARQQKGAVPRREPRATGPGEFFTRSRWIGTTSINRANANAASKSQKPHFTSRQSCGGYRVKKLGGSPSARPRRRPAVAPPLPCCFSCCFTTASLCFCFYFFSPITSSSPSSTTTSTLSYHWSTPSHKNKVQYTASKMKDREHEV